MFLLNTTEELTTERICKYIELHRKSLSERYQKLQDYYTGKHEILLRKPKRKDDPCNNVVCNYAKYISDIGSGFLIGEPYLRFSRIKLRHLPVESDPGIFIVQQILIVFLTRMHLAI